MEIQTVTLDNQKIEVIKREGNVYWLDVKKINFSKTEKIMYPPPVRPHKLLITFSGKPTEAKLPPWDGGWIFRKDDKGRQWMSVACQGLGASVWYPCKDYQGDEPDSGATLTMDVPDSLIAIANGRLKEKKSNNAFTSWTWEVKD